MGARVAGTVATILQRVRLPDLFGPQSILTVGLLLFGATAAFANMCGSLNTIWDIAPQDQSKKEMVLDVVRARIRGFVMVVVTALVVSVSFVVTAGASVLARVLHGWGVGPGLLLAVNDVVSLGLVGLLFGGIYRTLPNMRIEWGTVWVGAFATALLFLAGKSLVAWILSTASWASYYGSGASVVAFLAWIYFSSQIFFLGAEFTQVWSRHRGGVMSEAEHGA
jgi:membrane protein